MTAEKSRQNAAFKTIGLRQVHPVHDAEEGDEVPEVPQPVERVPAHHVDDSDFLCHHPYEILPYR